MVVRHLSPRSRAWLYGLSIGLAVVMLDVFLHGPLVRLDLWVIQYDGQEQHPWLDPVAQVYDKVAQRSVGVPILLIVAGILGRKHRTWRPLVLAFYSVASLNLVVGTMKVLIGRSETETGNSELFTGSAIFPSGHSSNVVLTGGLIVYLIRRYSKNPPTRQMIIVVAVMTALTVATSIYIGSHWVTDLVGGALVGGLLLQAVVIIDRATMKPQLPALAKVVVPSGGLRHEHDRDGVDAVPLAGRRLGRVVEEMPEVRSAPAAPDLRPTHAE